MTQAQLVTQLRRNGIDYMNASTLSRIEAGTRPVRLTEAQAISRVLRVGLTTMTSETDAFARADSENREAWRVYKEFSENVATLTDWQIRHALTISSLEKLAAKEELEPELRRDIKGLIHNLTTFAQMELAGVTRELVEEAKSKWSSGASKRLTQLNLVGEEVIDGEHQAKA